MSTLNFTIPTHIFVGTHEQTTATAIAILRDQWCLNRNNDCFCSTCKQLTHHQHRFLAWLKPTKDYTVDDLDPLFQTISFALDDDQRFFFVLEHGERLTQATANRLLKIFEEPPRGYHFILLTENLNALLPTIISRSEVVTLTQQAAAAPHPLLEYFLGGASLNAVLDFEQFLQRNKLSDSESTQLLDELFEQFSAKCNSAILTNDADKHLLVDITTFLQHAMAMPPQSGSSELFWKNLWVNIPRQ
jgi:DNA polymerase III gamma/tau subunit